MSLLFQDKWRDFICVKQIRIKNIFLTGYSSGKLLLNVQILMAKTLQNAK